MVNNIPQRFRHTELLVGAAGLAKLNCEKVAVIGLGGLGSYAVEALARAGIGWLILVDYDVIRPEDTNRELHAIEGFYGLPKVTALAERAKAINPEIAVVTWQEYLRQENLATILHGRISYVIDTTHSLPSQIPLIRYCSERGIPVISAADTGNRLDPFQLRIVDHSENNAVQSLQPLCEALWEHEIHSGVKLLYSTETPIPIETKTA
ncbi:MAG TPA: ThiF family adenylyltransferase, partial [Bacillota bacterium]|nr:ThiF family adenylyltransferase [Bacillota bacterium]